MQYLENRQVPIILHFGDHDPSGIDMTRDITERLAMYAETEVRVERLALTMEQVEEHEPPPNPAKTTDSRYARYIETCGSESWELDALPPSVLAGLAEQAMGRYRDTRAWNRTAKRQSSSRKRLLKLASEWKE
jgi:hypothetical protein